MDEINLKYNREYLSQYVDIRNMYSDQLLTRNVTISETQHWIKNHNVEVRGIVEGDVLAGAIVLYIDRAGEVAIFVKTPRKGIGSRLLKIIEPAARERGLLSVWAWVLESNKAARRVFEKMGFIKKETSARMFKSISRKGIQYEKVIS